MCPDETLDCVDRSENVFTNKRIANYLSYVGFTGKPVVLTGDEIPILDFFQRNYYEILIVTSITLTVLVLSTTIVVGRKIAHRLFHDTNNVRLSRPIHVIHDEQRSFIPSTKNKA